MKKNNFTGWQEVFRFSFMQGVKQKSYVIYLIVISLILLCIQPVRTIIQQLQNNDVKTTEMTQFVICDETGLGIDYTQCLADSRFQGVTVTEEGVEDFDLRSKQLEEAKDSTEILVSITYEEQGYFHATFIRAAKSKISKAECEEISEIFANYFEKEKLVAIDVSDDQYAFINQPVNWQVEFVSADGQISKDEDTSISMEEYIVILCGVMVVLFLVSISGGNVAGSIVTEKSTKIVEYLMINVRPMALIVGKLLSAVTLVVVQFLVMGVSYGISLLLQGFLLGGGKDTNDFVQLSTGILESFSQVTVGSVTIALLVIVLGVLFFGIVAGLAGASVSKMEEMAEGLKLYQLSLIVGAYIGIFLCIAQMSSSVSPIIINICAIFPLSAPFVIPIHLLLGKISMGTALVGMLLLGVCTAFLFSFTAKVYESMIFYNGNVMKLKDILQIAKRKKGSVEKGER